MTIRTSEALAFVSQAARGNLDSLGALLRALVTDDLWGAKLNVEAGAGFKGGVGGQYWSNVQRFDRVIRTRIFCDLTGLASSTTDLDIIGVGASVAHMGRITNAQNGIIFAGSMSCIEVPAGGADDIDLYAATEGTGVFDGGVTALTETALLTKGAAWTRLPSLLTALPANNDYLYLTGGEAGTAATYTAGQFLIELLGYPAS